MKLLHVQTLVFKIAFIFTRNVHLLKVLYTHQKTKKAKSWHDGFMDCLGEKVISYLVRHGLDFPQILSLREVKWINTWTRFSQKSNKVIKDTA